MTDANRRRTIDPAHMADIGRMGGATSRSRYSGAEMTEPARRAFWQKFEDEVDPDRVLDPAERHARAEKARWLYYKRLAAKSVKARKARKAAATGSGPAAA